MALKKKEEAEKKGAKATPLEQVKEFEKNLVYLGVENPKQFFEEGKLKDEEGLRKALEGKGITTAEGIVQAVKDNDTGLSNQLIYEPEAESAETVSRVEKFVGGTYVAQQNEELELKKKGGDWERVAEIYQERERLSTVQTDQVLESAKPHVEEGVLQEFFQKFALNDSTTEEGRKANRELFDWFVEQGVPEEKIEALRKEFGEAEKTGVAYVEAIDQGRYEVAEKIANAKSFEEVDKLAKDLFPPGRWGALCNSIDASFAEEGEMEEPIQNMLSALQFFSKYSGKCPAQ